MYEKIDHSRANGLMHHIGNTPLVQLQSISSKNLDVFGKLESKNPGGSIKDRTAKKIIEDALDRGAIKAGDRVIESSSGNMAIGLAMVCRYYNLKLTIVTDPKLNSQTEHILKAYGTTLEKVTQPMKNGGFLGSRLKRVKELCENYPNSFWSDQYHNPLNPKAHHDTMREINVQLDNEVDYLFVATSTCGTIMGCADYIIQQGLSTKLVAIDAYGSVLFGDKAEKRLIPGHGSGMPSHFLKTENIHKVVQVNDRECVVGCRELLKEEALLCGGSSGAIWTAFQKIKHKINEPANVVFILCDSGERYLDTIYNQHWVDQNFKDQTAV